MSTDFTHTLADLETGRWQTSPSVDHDGSRCPSASVQAVTGWSLKPQGLCREDLCVPVADRHQLEAREGVLDLRTFAESLDLPRISQSVGPDHFTVLGRRLPPEPPTQAPDFELPDLSGTVHKLSEFRGRKVLLIAWAGW